jgi:hypothetical protein
VRFVVERWDIRSFAGKVPEEERAICIVWDEADQSGSSSFAALVATDKVAGSAELDLVREQQGFRSTSEERSERLSVCVCDAAQSIM